MNVTNYLSLMALASLAILVFYSTPTMACMCMVSHPQTQYCNADYGHLNSGDKHNIHMSTEDESVATFENSCSALLFVLVRVLRKSNRLVEHHIAYKVEIKKSYKMTPEGQKELRHGRLVTSAFGSTCGVKLELGKLYVIAGKRSDINICNYVKEYQNMTVVERKGISGLYRKACSCEVRECAKSGPAQNMFDPCIPVTYLTPEGPIRQCRWTRTHRYDKPNP